MKDKKVLAIILVAVLLLGGLASINAKTTLSDYIMSLIKGGQGECGGRTCECTIECNAYESQCTGADDCGGKPCVPVDCPTEGEGYYEYCAYELAGGGSCFPPVCKGGTKCNNEDNPCPSGGDCMCTWNCSGSRDVCKCK